MKIKLQFFSEFIVDILNYVRKSNKINIFSHILQNNFDYICFGLFGFYGISTILGYLTPNLVYTYILNIWFVSA